MLSSTIQALLYEGVTLISERKLPQASERHNLALRLLEEHGEGVPSRTLSHPPTIEYSLVPLSQDFHVASPAWDDEIFAYPFIIHYSEPQSNSLAGTELSETGAALFKSLLLFHEALCNHLQAIQDEKTSTQHFIRAIKYYNEAWASIQRYLACLAQDQAPQGTMFFLMAFCTNLTRCYYLLGQLDASDSWQSNLHNLLAHCGAKEDKLSAKVRDFFTMRAFLQMKCIAAGCA